jgi:hypothetical protein
MVLRPKRIKKGGPRAQRLPHSRMAGSGVRQVLGPAHGKRGRRFYTTTTTTSTTTTV